MTRLSRSFSWVAKAAAIVAAVSMMAFPLASSAQVYVGFNVGAPPPALPYYSQPALSVPGETWQPGYWAWGPAGYYWVPGTWVMPPSANSYWTPGYWGYNNGGYGWNNGYWGSQVGYYGGINYGFGYPGTGFYGGNWNNGLYRYNTAYTNVNPVIVRNVYVNRAHYVTPIYRTRYSFNGPRGVIMHPTHAQLVYARERHIAATPAQISHARIAAQDRNLYYNVNHGRPAVVAVARPINSTHAIPHYAAVRTTDHVTTSKTVTTHTVTHTNASQATVTHNTTMHTTPEHITPTHTTTSHTTTATHNTSATHNTPTHTTTATHNTAATHNTTASHPAHQPPQHAAPAKAPQPAQGSEHKKPPHV
jgi:hypothetical protein